MANCRHEGMKVFSVSARNGCGIKELRESIRENFYKEKNYEQDSYDFGC